ncbi:bifunctional phosphoribosyl-AMP cyclohydrolase/phosphoribosyl-ATP diphosphatase HisIE [Steroidobacter denitrificans]
MTLERVSQLAWNKGDGLLPAIVQDAGSGQVLMLGYMNKQALRATLTDRRVTFYSRSKQRLWTKGETSGNFLKVVDVAADCDQDALLVMAIPVGPTCHQGTRSCFADAVASEATRLSFLAQLEAVIAQRIGDRPEGSYTARLWSQGLSRMAQKVGEEGVEVALAAVTQADGALVSESADLVFHLALLLRSRGLSLTNIVQELEGRHVAKP